MSEKRTTVETIEAIRDVRQMEIGNALMLEAIARIGLDCRALLEKLVERGEE